LGKKKYKLDTKDTSFGMQPTNILEPNPEAFKDQDTDMGNAMKGTSTTNSKR
jgi:hypothetical protein